ncbi:porin family protein [Campylobacter jejuni]|nr:porin family protein [Campylobacter jejuni]
MNKKLLSIVASATLFSNLALADENSGFFIGADAAFLHTKVKSDLKHNGNKSSVINGDMIENIPVLDLKIGYRLNQLHRIYFLYANSDGFDDFITTPQFNIEADFSINKFLLGYDFTPELFEKTRGVLGVYSGYARTDIDLKTSRLSLSKKFDGFVYGVKAEQIRYNSRNFYENSIGSNFYDPKQTNYSIYLGYAYKF